MSAASLQFIRAQTLAQVVLAVAEARTLGLVPLVGDPRWSEEHWQLVRNRWEGETLPQGAAWAALSSGSTGNPRLIVRSDKSWTESFAVLNRILGLTEADLFYLPGSPASSLTLFSIAHAANLGAHVTSQLQTVSQTGEVRQATVFHGTPALLRTLLNQLETRVEPAGESGLNLPANSVGEPGIRVALVGGDVLDAQTRARAAALGIRVFSYYGAAELSFVAIDPDGKGLLPFEGVELRIDDGQLWVRSPYRAIGYLGDGGALRETADGWVTVGDLARYTATEGRLAIRGRADGAIQIAGATVVPEDVEAALTQLESVAQAVVFGIPNANIGNLVAAVVVFKAEAPASARTAQFLNLKLSAVLSNTHRPRQWFVAEAIPATISGKPARLKVQQSAVAGEYQKLD